MFQQWFECCSGNEEAGLTGLTAAQMRVLTATEIRAKAETAHAVALARSVGVTVAETAAGGSHAPGGWHGGGSGYGTNAAAVHPVQNGYNGDISGHQIGDQWYSPGVAQGYDGVPGAAHGLDTSYSSIENPYGEMRKPPQNPYHQHSPSFGPPITSPNGIAQHPQFFERNQSFVQPMQPPAPQPPAPQPPARFEQPQFFAPPPPPFHNHPPGTTLSRVQPNSFAERPHFVGGGQPSFEHQSFQQTAPPLTPVYDTQEQIYDHEAHSNPSGSNYRSNSVNKYYKNKYNNRAKAESDYKLEDTSRQRRVLPNRRKCASECRAPHRPENMAAPPAGDSSNDSSSNSSGGSRRMGPGRTRKKSSGWTVQSDGGGAERRRGARNDYHSDGDSVHGPGGLPEFLMQEEEWNGSDAGGGRKSSRGGSRGENRGSSRPPRRVSGQSGRRSGSRPRRSESRGPERRSRSPFSGAVSQLSGWSDSPGDSRANGSRSGSRAGGSRSSSRPRRSRSRGPDCETSVTMTIPAHMTRTGRDMEIEIPLP